MRTIGLLGDHRPDQVPVSYRDLVECPPVAVLSTVTSGGYPQSSVVWCDFDGECLRVNTMRGFAEERNMRRDPRVTLLCYDPREPLRYLEVRGTVVEMTESGARAQRRTRLEVRRAADALLRRRRPGTVREDRDSGPVSDPADARRRRRRDGEGEEDVTTRVAETMAIPASHLDLLTRPICGVFTTMGTDGQPQSSLVWVDADDGCGQLNTTLERQKGRNLLANPKVSLLVVDPENTSRYIQIRGDAELVTDGAVDHLDALTRKYTRHPRFYGCVYPVEQRERETRVICRIQASRISVDAIHFHDH